MSSHCVSPLSEHHGGPSEQVSEQVSANEHKVNHQHKVKEGVTKQVCEPEVKGREAATLR